MNIENFEKQAKALLNHYLQETDNEQIWANIEPHLKKKRKRRGFILFFWGIGLAILLGSLCWKNIHSRVLATTQINSLQVPHPDRPLNPQASAEDHVNGTSHGTATQSLGSGDDSHVNRTGEAGGEKRQLQGKHSPTDTIHPTLPKMVKVTPSTLYLGNQTAAEKSGFPPEQPATASTKTIGSGNETPSTVSTTISPTALAPEMKSTPDSTVVIRTTSLAKDKNESAGSNADESMAKPKKTLPHLTKKRKSTLMHAISLHAGPVLPFKSLKQNTRIQTSEDFLQNRRSSEKSLEGFSASVNYTLSTKKGLLFKGGLDYQRLNEKFYVHYTSKKVETIQGIISVTVDANGAVIDQTYGDKKVTTTTQYANKVYNHYQLLNLPLGMGYQRVHKKSRWELAGGLDLNLLFRFKGTLYNEAGFPIPLAYPGTKDVFREKLGLDIWASYGFSRNLTKNIRWQISAQAKLPFKAVTQPDYPIIQRYTTMGVQGGLVFNLIEANKAKSKMGR